MLPVPPAALMAGNEALAHLLEGHDLGGLDRGCGLQLASVLARIIPRRLAAGSLRVARGHA